MTLDPGAFLPLLLSKATPILLATGSVLLFLISAFVCFFVVPGLHLRIRLARVFRRLRNEAKASTADLHSVFDVDVKLRHLWMEFHETLHAQKEERDGELVTVALRATAPAESFINAQYIVDSRLRTEFFKHLPGIFTGVGIIGTFLGLIQGLQAFNISDDAGQVRESLDYLLGGVFDAFLVSATAITFAMLVTVVEKALLASLYRCTEDIAQYLDSLFTAGAGEEYLARLVTASEDSASQSKILKDALVGDLKVILQQMADRQIAAQTENSEALGKHITSGIASSLQEPLRHIGDIVAKASGDQSSAAAALLKDVMASFSQRLNELFGGQISGIQELNQKSAQAMQDAVASLNHLVGRIEEHSQRSGDAMAERMASAVEEMSHRQAEINRQTNLFVEGIREIMLSSQTETNNNLNEAIVGLNKHVSEMISALQGQVNQSQDQHHLREQRFTERAAGMVTAIEESIGEVVKQMANSTTLMQQSVASLERTTVSAIDKLNSGAKTLEQGATTFAQAGANVTSAMNRSATVADKMTEVSGSLTSAASALQGILADYRSNRDATSSMLSEVRVVVEAAKREASLTQQSLERIQSAATKLADAQRETEKYLEGVSEVLAEAHGTFAAALTRTLDRANSDFHKKLSTAVGLLSSAVEELEVSVSSATAVRR